MKENTPKFPSSEIWYQAAFWRYLGLIWVIYNFFIKQFITAIQSKISQWWKLLSDQTRVKSLFKTNEKYRYGLRKSLSKHLKMLLTSKIIRIAWAKFLLMVLPSPVLFFQVRIDTCTLLSKYLWFSQTLRLGHSEALRAVNLRRFLARRLLRSMCEEKQFVQFKKSLTTLNATIAWVENSVG